jgi:hypothetical protein
MGREWEEIAYRLSICCTPTSFSTPLPTRVGSDENTRSLDDPSPPRLDLGQLFRSNRLIHKKPSFLFVKLPLPQATPEKPQKTVDESDSPTIYCG